MLTFGADQRLPLSVFQPSNQATGRTRGSTCIPSAGTTSAIAERGPGALGTGVTARPCPVPAVELPADRGGGADVRGG